MTAVEYALIVALVAVTALGGLFYLRDTTQTTFDSTMSAPGVVGCDAVNDPTCADSIQFEEIDYGGEEPPPANTCLPKTLSYSQVNGTSASYTVTTATRPITGTPLLSGDAGGTVTSSATQITFASTALDLGTATISFSFEVNGAPCVGSTVKITVVSACSTLVVTGSQVVGSSQLYQVLDTRPGANLQSAALSPSSTATATITRVSQQVRVANPTVGSVLVDFDYTASNGESCTGLLSVTVSTTACSVKNLTETQGLGVDATYDVTGSGESLQSATRSGGTATTGTVAVQAGDIRVTGTSTPGTIIIDFTYRIGADDCTGNTLTVTVTTSCSVLNVSASQQYGSTVDHAITLAGSPVTVLTATKTSGGGTVSVTAGGDIRLANPTTVGDTVISFTYRTASGETCSGANLLTVTVATTCSTLTPTRSQLLSTTQDYAITSGGSTVNVTAASVTSGSGTVTVRNTGEIRLVAASTAGTTVIAFTYDSSSGQSCTGNTLTVNVISACSAVTRTDSQVFGSTVDYAISVGGAAVTVTAATKTSGSGTVTVRSGGIRLATPTATGTTGISFTYDASNGESCSGSTLTITVTTSCVALTKTATQRAGTSNNHNVGETVTAATRTSGTGTVSVSSSPAGQVRLVNPTAGTTVIAFTYTSGGGETGCSGNTLTVTVS